MLPACRWLIPAGLQRINVNDIMTDSSIYLLAVRLQSSKQFIRASYKVAGSRSSETCHKKAPYARRLPPQWKTSQST